MTDIVERLRHFSLARSGELRANPDAVMADEAKAEIERLRRELDNCAQARTDWKQFWRMLPDNEIAYPDRVLREALGVLHRMATEETGWRSIFRRWYYSDEPLRHDAANIVRAAGFEMARPDGTRLLKDGSK